MTKGSVLLKSEGAIASYCVASMIIVNAGTNGFEKIMSRISKSQQAFISFILLDAQIVNEPEESHPVNDKNAVK